MLYTFALGYLWPDLTHLDSDGVGGSINSAHVGIWIMEDGYWHNDRNMHQLQLEIAMTNAYRTIFSPPTGVLPKS